MQAILLAGGLGNQTSERGKRPSEAYGTDPG